MPDRPPDKVPQYARVNTNLIDWRLDRTWCPDVIPLSELSDLLMTQLCT